MSTKSPPGAADQERVLLEQLKRSPESLTLSLLQIAEREQARVLLFVDQLEELDTHVEDREERALFMDAICAAADDPEDPIRVVFTLRDDFLVRLSASERARRAMSRITVLRSPGPESLEEIINRPLDAAGYRYEEGLAQEMVDEVAGEAACLPLLQFACNELWESRDKRAKLLTRAAYEGMGGVGGSLARQADGVIQSLPPSQVAAAKDIFLRLVTSEGTRRVVPRTQLLEGLGPEAEEVLDRLIAARSLVLRKGYRGAAGDAEVEIVHESLIDNWGRLRAWIEENRDDLAFLAELEQAALLWQRRGHNDDEVWKGAALHDALEKARRIEVVPPLCARFLDAGFRLERRRSSRKRLVLGAVFAGMLLVAALLAWQNRQVGLQKDEAVSQRHRAESERAEALLEGARTAARDGDQLEARAKLRMSLEAVDSVEGRALLWRLERTPLLWESSAYPVSDVTWLPRDERLLVDAGGSLCSVDPRTGEYSDCKQEGRHVFFCDLSRDGRLLASGGTEISVLDRVSETEVLNFKLEEDRAFTLEFSPADDVLIASTAKKRMIAWDTKTFRPLFDLQGASVWSVFHPISGDIIGLEGAGVATVRDPRTGEIKETIDALGEGWISIDVSPDGELLLVGNRKGEVGVWSLRERAKLEVLEGEGTITRIEVSPDGRRAFIGNDTGVLRVWDLTSGEILETLAADMGTIATVVLVDRDRVLVAGDQLGTLRAWDVSHRDRVRPPIGHDGIFLTGALRRDGEIIASAANDDDRVLTWDAATGAPLGGFETPAGNVHTLAFDWTGDLVAAGGDSGVVALHDVASGRVAKTFYGHEKAVRSLAFHPGGRILASGDAGGAVLIWDTDEGTILARLEDHASTVGALAFSPDGDEFASSGSDGKVVLRPTSDWRATKTLDAATGYSWRAVAYSPDGSTLAYGGPDRTLMLYDRQNDKAEAFARFEGSFSAFYVQMAFTPDGKAIGASPGDGFPKVLWDLETGKILKRSNNPIGPARVFAIGPGSRYAAVDDATAVRVWDMETGLPRWKAPLMLESPRRLYTHLGWIDMTTGKPAEPPAHSEWRRAVEERAMIGDMTPDGETLCLLTGDFYLEQWDPRGDALVTRAKLDLPYTVRAIPDGCVALSSRADDTSITTVHILRKGLPAQKIQDSIFSISVSGDRIYMGSESRVHEHALDGTRLRSFEIEGSVTGVARIGDEIAVAYFDGGISFYDAKTLTLSERKLKLAPPAPIELMVEGPGDTLVTSAMSGAIDLWHLPTGKHLDRFKLNGRMAHLAMDGARLFAATDLGDHETYDLHILKEDRCAVLRRIWDEIPIVWRSGRAVPEPPPKNHPCAAAR